MDVRYELLHELVLIEQVHLSEQAGKSSRHSYSEPYCASLKSQMHRQGHKLPLFSSKKRLTASHWHDIQLRCILADEAYTWQKPWNT